MFQNKPQKAFNDIVLLSNKSIVCEKIQVYVPIKLKKCNISTPQLGLSQACVWLQMHL